MTAIYAATVILFILNFPIKLTAAACFETANKRVFGKLKIFGIKIIDFGAEAYLSGITVYFAKKRKILGVSDVKKAVSVPMIKGMLITRAIFYARTKSPSSAVMLKGILSLVSMILKIFDNALVPESVIEILDFNESVRGNETELYGLCDLVLTPIIVMLPFMIAAAKKIKNKIIAKNR